MRNAFRLRPAIAAVLLGLAPAALPPLVADDDPLPPFAPAKNSPPPADWSAWTGVAKLVGESHAQIDTRYEHAVTSQRQEYFRQWTSAQFRLEPDPESARLSKRRVWRVTEAHGRGGEISGWSLVSIWERNIGKSSGTYAGPMSLRTRPALSLDLTTGKWAFNTLEPARPWTLNTKGFIRDQNRDETVMSSSEQQTLENSWVEATAPRQVGALFGSFRRDMSHAAGAVAGKPGVTTGLRTATVQFWPDWDDVEVLVEIENYAKWRPRGNLANTAEPGEVPLQLSATLRPKKPNPTPAEINALPQVRRFRFELADTSREPGVCLNWPVFGDDASAVPKEDPGYDLRLRASPDLPTILSPKRQKAGVIPTTDALERPVAWVRLDCYDFGAHADLRVVAELADGREIVGFIESSDGPRYTVKIPERTDGSLVAKNWRDAENVTSADSADDDHQPKVDGQDGDGFSVYEEYRGFRVDGAHVRLKPDRKDLFISNRIGELVEPGLKLFSTKTTDPRGGHGFAVHSRLQPFEKPASREMNANRSEKSPRTAKETQHALVLQGRKKGASKADFGAKDDDKKKIPWRPKNVEVVYLRTNLTERDTMSTAAHEISHAIGGRHHGHTDLRDVIWKRVKESGLPAGSPDRHYFHERPAKQNDATGLYEPDGSLGQRIRLFRESNGLREIDPNSEEAATLFVASLVPWVARYGGEHSGNVDCWMRYDYATAYVPPHRPDDRVMVFAYDDPHPVDDELPGLSLCDSPRGTGVNEPTYNRNHPRYGVATNGNCRDQLCVRDDAPDRYQGR